MKIFILISLAIIEVSFIWITGMPATVFILTWLYRKFKSKFSQSLPPPNPLDSTVKEKMRRLRYIFFFLLFELPGVYNLVVYGITPWSYLKESRKVFLKKNEDQKRDEQYLNFDCIASPVRSNDTLESNTSIDCYSLYEEKTEIPCYEIRVNELVNNFKNLISLCSLSFNKDQAIGSSFIRSNYSIIKAMNSCSYY